MSVSAEIGRRRSPERRSRILAAALTCFNDKGFRGATIEDVCRLSGASVGSIYHHFGGKEGLAAALYVQGLEDYQRGFLAVLDRQSDAKLGIEALVRHHLRWVARHCELARFLLEPREPALALATEARVRDMNRTLFARTEGWRRQHVEAGRLLALPLDLFYTILIGPAQLFSREWVHGRATSSMTTAQAALAEAAWRALAAPPPE
ncbi:MAG: TetR/AcrR family transcriptional regulator [bacterium]|jgi:AcrR family transcriptional regulator|nr:TetR/AcrR family transcriptional regulator [bacterium]